MIEIKKISDILEDIIIENDNNDLFIQDRCAEIN